MWTPDALSSEARPYRAEVWRVVESQSRAATMRLTDSLHDQQLLEDLIDEVKPALPPACRGLHYLLATPFRYAPYPHGSRFRRAGQRDGVFYAAEDVFCAMAETAFYRLLFFAESPATRLPERPTEHTAFAVPCASERALDLTAPPLSDDGAQWTDRSDYAACQALADTARAAGVEVIRYASVRDPDGGRNVAVLTPAALAAREPQQVQTWRVFIRLAGVQVAREFPPATREYPEADFGADPRLATFWQRP
ncbi:RES family NAD+ phosphorylase [Caenispirillum bisanense]|uniref:RES family NAD+ phosphorylase n=1 Tax=Caenispirillum bisanense TaxID=414052 RepID=UPI0031D6E157